jgi:hypothetical protein
MKNSHQTLVVIKKVFVFHSRADEFKNLLEEQSKLIDKHGKRDLKTPLLKKDERDIFSLTVEPFKSTGELKTLIRNEGKIEALAYFGNRSSKTRNDLELAVKSDVFLVNEACFFGGKLLMPRGGFEQLGAINIQGKTGRRG